MRKIEDLIAWAQQNEKNCIKSAAEHDPDSIEFSMYYEEAEKYSVISQVLQGLLSSSPRILQKKEGNTSK